MTNSHIGGTFLEGSSIAAHLPRELCKHHSKSNLWAICGFLSMGGEAHEWPLWTSANVLGPGRGPGPSVPINKCPSPSSESLPPI